jgi:hypothetical protein
VTQNLHHRNIIAIKKCWVDALNYVQVYTYREIHYNNIPQNRTENNIRCIKKGSSREGLNLLWTSYTSCTSYYSKCRH